MDVNGCCHQNHQQEEFVASSDEDGINTMQHCRGRSSEVTAEINSWSEGGRTDHPRKIYTRITLIKKNQIVCCYCAFCCCHFWFTHPWQSVEPSLPLVAPCCCCVRPRRRTGQNRRRKRREPRSGAQWSADGRHVSTSQGGRPVVCVGEGWDAFIPCWFCRSRWRHRRKWFWKAHSIRSL